MQLGYISFIWDLFIKYDHSALAHELVLKGHKWIICCWTDATKWEFALCVTPIAFSSLHELVMRSTSRYQEAKSLLYLFASVV